MQSFNGMVTTIGFIAATLTTISFLPQVLHVWKTRSTHDLSLGMFLLFALGLICWLIYGIFTHSLPVIVANTITLIPALIIIIFKLIYK